MALVVRKMGVVGSSEMSEQIYYPTRCKKPEENNLNNTLTYVAV